MAANILNVLLVGCLDNDYAEECCALKSSSKHGTQQVRCNVTLTCDIDKAKNIIHEQNCDIVLMDLESDNSLDNLSSLSVNTSTIPFIAIGSEDNQDRINSAFSMGITDHFPKKEIYDINFTKYLLYSIKNYKQLIEQDKIEFIRGASYELRTPLSEILGVTQILAENYQNREQIELTEVIKESASSLLDSINNLLVFWETNPNSYKLEKNSFSLSSIIEDTIENLESPAQHRKLTIVTDIASDVPDRLIGDKIRLSQVAYNLLSNAIKFTREEGGIIFYVEKEWSTNEVICLHFIVADSGAGINAKSLSKSLDKSENHSSDVSIMNNGIGLITANKLINLMGGELWIKSMQEKGTAFHFTAQFSLENSDSIEMKIARIEATSTHSSEKMDLLVIERAGINQRVVQAILNKLGHTSTVVHNLDDAANLLKENRYDTVLLNPFIEGPNIEIPSARLRSLVDSESDTHIPIVALLSAVKSEILTQIFNVGIDAYVTKPLNKKIVRDILEKHMPRTEHKENHK